MSHYTLSAIENFLAKYSGTGIISAVKITRLLPGHFDDMVGRQFTIGVKVLLSNGRYKLYTIATNSSYLDDFDYSTLEDLREQVSGHLNGILAA